MRSSSVALEKLSRSSKGDEESGLCVAQKFHDFLDRVPIARRNGNAEDLLELPEITDGFHLAAVQSENESALDRNDLQQPLIWRGETIRKIKRKRRSSEFR